MNERIQELAKQAGGHNNISKFRGHFLPPRPEYIDSSTVDLEKFVDLIVQEMCDVLDKAQWDKGEDWVCADGTRIIPQIKRHFGVAE